MEYTCDDGVFEKASAGTRTCVMQQVVIHPDTHTHMRPSTTQKAPCSFIRTTPRKRSNETNTKPHTPLLHNLYQDSTMALLVRNDNTFVFSTTREPLVRRINRYVVPLQFHYRFSLPCYRW